VIKDVVETEHCCAKYNVQQYDYLCTCWLDRTTVIIVFIAQNDLSIVRFLLEFDTSTELLSIS